MSATTKALNRSQAIAAVSLLGVIGASVFIIQPGFVQGLVAHLGLSETQAGHVATAEMGGLALATILLSFLSGLLNWHRLLHAGAALMIAGNLLSPLAQETLPLGALRFAVGLGSGILVSLSFAAIGLTAKADRNFGIYMSAVLTYGAFGLLIMPTIFDVIGMSGLFLALTLIAFGAIPLVRFVPPRAEAANEQAPDAVDLPSAFRVLALLAMLAYFLAQGVVWAYLFLIGLDGGLGEQEVANALTLCQFFGIAGALTTTLLGQRLGRAGPLAVGIVASILSLAYLHGGMTFALYAFGVSLFNFAWNMVHPFLLAAMASFDRRGRMVIYAVAAQVLGLAIGPSIGAALIGDGDYWSVNIAGMAFFAVSLALILPPLIRQKALSRDAGLGSGRTAP